MAIADRAFFRAYIDEVGDRGSKPRSSRYFCMAAVVVRDTNDRRLRDEWLPKVCAGTGRPDGQVVKWRKLDHFGKRLATEAMVGLPVRIIYVVVPKATLRQTSAMAQSAGRFYNFAARLLVERVSRLVDEHDGVVKLTFEKVKGFPEHEVTSYFALLRRQAGRPGMSIRWDAVHLDIRVASPGEVRGLCAANVAVGAMDFAIRPQAPTGLVEPAYLSNLAPLVWRGGNPPRVLRYGIKVLAPDDTALTEQSWWPGSFAT